MSIIKMSYGHLQSMAQTFRQSSEHTETLINEINLIAEALQDGALIGQGGDAFEEACRMHYIPALNRLKDKFDEMNRDLLMAVNGMQDTDIDTQKLY